MASLQMSQALGHTYSHNTNNSVHSSSSNLFKARSRTVVKPILKKLHSSHSEKNSLDLDRAWEDQNFEPGYFGRDDDADHAMYAPVAAAGTGRLTRDVSFTLSATDLPSMGNARTQYSHNRSTSGASHGSIATNGSGRNGSFVHPFQQTPRTSTPPLSYANSFVSLDNAPPASRDYSPTITEYESDHDPKPYVTRAPRSYQQHPSVSNPRRPSLASQRTSSLTDITQSLRMSASRSNTGAAQSLGHAGSVNHSRSDLHALTSPSSSETPLSSTAPLCASPPSTSSNPISPLRSSLDMNGFRLRSRSELDTATRQEQVRQARRKFEEKEKVKEEKYAREQVRKREKADTKEAQRFEKAQAHHRSRTSLSNPGLVSGRNSSSTEARPSASRKSTSNSRVEAAAEKAEFASRSYDTVADGQTPNARAEDVHFQHTTKKTNTAKRKTTGAWTAFVLWLRTRLLKMGRR